MGLNLTDMFSSRTSSEPDDVPAGVLLDDPSPDSMGEGETWCEGGQHFYHRETTRGRVPKSCRDHRTSGGGSKTSVKPSGKPGSAAQLSDLENRIALMVGKVSLGFAASPLKTTGAVLAMDAPEWARCTIELCKDNPRALAVLDSLTKTLPAAELAQLGARAVVAAGTDVGRIPPDHILSEMLNVREVWEKLNGPFTPKLWDPPPTPPAFHPIGA